MSVKTAKPVRRHRIPTATTRRKLSPILALAAALAWAPALAQSPPLPLTLSDALVLASEHNPEYRSQLNDAGVAEWGVRAAYGAFLPTASVSGGMSYQGGGQALIGGFTADDIGLGRTPAYYFSSYSVGVNLGLDGSTFYRVGQEKASRDAVVAGIEAAGQTLRAAVTRQYLAALRSRDGVSLARAELERAQANLSLTEARHAVESVTILEVKQAQVERGRAEVELLRAEAGFETEKLRLLERIGLDLDRDVELATEVRVFDPRWELEPLLQAASVSQPQLEAARARATAAHAGVAMARSAYWPRLMLSAGQSGYTRRVGSDAFLLQRAEDGIFAARDNCRTVNEILVRLSPPMPAQDCDAIVLTDADRDRILSQNRQFPFSFDREPISMSVGLSIPLFQGLGRQHQLESARAGADGATLRVRAEELRIRAEVMAAHRNLRAAYQAAQLEERNRELADDQLRLARERYRVGAASFLELMEAGTLKARADRAHLLGVYAFQEALTALEAAVGQQLAIPQNGQAR